jgi:imidazoleglycerol-phosphate dehydratase
MPKIKIERKTKETDILLSLDLYGSGESAIKSGIGFFDHMLELFTYHGCFDLDVRCDGDLDVDGHHTVEDIGICLGQAFNQSAPQSKGIVRYATAFVPMDESLARAVVDVSGRPHLIFDAEFTRPIVGEFATELVREFFQAFTNHAQINLHLKIEYGTNTHHRIEALFKATAIALRRAIETDPERKGPTSTKGVL